MERLLKAAVVTILIPILWVILLFVGIIVLMLPFVALVRPDLVQINGDKDTPDKGTNKT